MQGLGRRTGREHSTGLDHVAGTWCQLTGSAWTSYCSRAARTSVRATVVSERTYPGANTTTGVAVSGDRLPATNSQMDTYLYGAPLTSPVLTAESLPLH